MGVTAMTGIDVGRLDACIATDGGEGATVLRVAGQLDLATADDLADRLRDVLDARTGSIVLDLSGVDFIDTSGLSVLLGAVDRHPGRIRLGPASRRVDRLLEVSGTRPMFD
jgi:anti-sigma B factor antagonist